MEQKYIKKWILEACQNLNLNIVEDEIKLEHPGDNKFGDLSTNIAMALAKKEKMNPNELAKKIKEGLEKSINSIETVEKIEVAGAGFINFYLKTEFLAKLAEKINYEIEFRNELSKNLENKKYLLEHTSAEPVKTIHIGHLRNNFLGMSVHNILEILGADVTLDYINNDRGMKISKAMWGYLVFGDKSKIKNLKIENFIEKAKSYDLSDNETKKIIESTDWNNVLASWRKDKNNWYIPSDFDICSDKFDNIFYALGHKAGELDEEVKKQFQEILKEWENENEDIRELWKQIIDWSMEGYKKTFDRIGSRIDNMWHESEFYKSGKEWVEKGLKIGVFQKLPDGAILTNLKDYKLPDTIVIKNDGTSMYITQDIQLTYQKVNQFPSDLYIWTIGSEQKLHMEQMFAVCDQLKIVKKEKLFHLNYGFITLKGGMKMGSRFGGVINGDDLLDELKSRAKEIIGKAKEKKSVENIDELAEKIAVSACKFGFLKYERSRDFSFDINESLSLEGDSGPYVQYTYARCLSVLEKTKIKEQKNIDNIPEKINPEEEALLKEFYKFEEKIIEASERFSPSVIAEYLLSIARKYNEFYGKIRIIDQPEETFRIFLTKTTASILEIGLGLLGIKTIEKM